MDKRLAIETINLFEDINFNEQIEGESVIGYINDCGRCITVLYQEDNIGKYLTLLYAIKKQSNANEVLKYLTRWIVNGRHKILEDKILLYTIIPILDEQFLGKQIRHALHEIWDMSNIAENAPE